MQPIPKKSVNNLANGNFRKNLREAEIANAVGTQFVWKTHACFC